MERELLRQLHSGRKSLVPRKPCGNDPNVANSVEVIKEFGRLVKDVQSRSKRLVQLLWMHYKAEMHSVYGRMNRALLEWTMRKYKKFRQRRKRAWDWLAQIAKR
ncbi:hypothetical protein [Paenibacillus roseus]|uniref:hypothetical protein n=1 Tax=Paenibacillus roseus TaxID=2798579 RepID=UPI001E43E122|nr:hypothetical protein [Paenibacillus roseus]